MTTSDTFSSYPAPKPPATGRRLLRRSRTDRVAAGVSGGLGEYFGVDPVLFRVLFATAAFFGGAGILAYVLAWAAIPEVGTARAPIDGWIGALRRRRFPVWLAVVAAAVVLWIVAFSWWAPGPFLPVIAVVVLIVVFFGRRELQSSPIPSTDPGTRPGGPAAASVAAPAVDLTKDASDSPTASETPVAAAGGHADPAGVRTEPVVEPPLWTRDARAWFDEAREASRRRRRRSLPIRVAILATLAATLTVLAVIDAVTGIELQVYFWASLGIVGIGLLAGLVSRRLPLAMAPLLIPAIAGSIAFGGSHASLHDGFGQREWKPVGAPSTQYRLAFGQGILDLRAMPSQDGPRRIDVTVGAGQVKIIAARTLNLTVLANIHIGQLNVDGSSGTDDAGTGGVGITRTVSPPAGATGAPLTVVVHLADGNLTVDHR